jgi:uncharacterized membrane protein YhhN
MEKRFNGRTWAVIVAAVAALELWGEYRGPAALVYAAKPLTMGLIIAMAVGLARRSESAYGRTILVGLALSLVGDVLLMLPADLFLPGLVSFLLAHVAYIRAFSRGRPWRPSAAAVCLAVYGAAVYVWLWPGLDALRWPVLVYLAVICTMGWQALDRWRGRRDRTAALAAAGALLFIVSDTALAVNRFGRPFAAAPLVVLTTYFAAQWCIARSMPRMIT